MTFPLLEDSILSTFLSLRYFQDLPPILWGFIVEMHVLIWLCYCIFFSELELSSEGALFCDAFVL